MKKTIASVVLAIASTGAVAEEALNSQPVAQQPVAAQTVGNNAIQSGSQWLWPVVTGGVVLYYIVTDSRDKPAIDDTNATTDTAG